MNPCTGYRVGMYRVAIMIETFTISVFGQKEGFMVKYGPRELCIRFVCHYYKIVWIRGAYPKNVDKIYG